jgi:hypothetical protein
MSSEYRQIEILVVAQLVQSEAVQILWREWSLLQLDLSMRVGRLLRTRTRVEDSNRPERLYIENAGKQVKIKEYRLHEGGQGKRARVLLGSEIIKREIGE